MFARTPRRHIGGALTVSLNHYSFLGTQLVVIALLRKVKNVIVEQKRCDALVNFLVKINFCKILPITSIQECDHFRNKCCNASLCTLLPGALCSHGECCEDCKVCLTQWRNGRCLVL